MRKNAPDFSELDPHCVAKFFDEKGGDPLTIILVPDTHHGERRQRCIAQELAHSTGLTFDTDLRSDTVFSGALGAEQITMVDMQLLQILYDPRLRNGMTWDEAKPIVRQIISEVEASPWQ